MSDQNELAGLLEGLRDKPDQLIGIILRQAQVIVEQKQVIEQLELKIRQLEEQLSDLNDRNGKLQGRVEELERTAARQAAPFRIRETKRVALPKKPGRPKGHAPARRPVPSHIDERIVVPLPQCPDCQGPLSGSRPVVQYIEDIPPVRPRVVELTTFCANCARCQKHVRSTHPMQVSLAEGAAGVQLGPNAIAVACDLNKRHGLTVRRTTAVLKSLFGLSVSPGGLVQAMHRMAGRLSDHYQAMIETMRAGPVIHGDETSWWVGRPGWWLWVFTSAQQTIYHVAEGRGRNVLIEMIGSEYQGVLVSDCLAIYDRVNDRQQKCYSHHLKAISEAAKEKPSPYLEEVRALLKGAMALKGADVSPERAQQSRAALETRADQLLSAPRTEATEEKVRARLWKQRDHLFTFLDHPQVPATNNLAERQLRPAVIARKLSCGNRTAAGARTWQVLASLAATCGQLGQSFAEFIAGTAALQPQR